MRHSRFKAFWCHRQDDPPELFCNAVGDLWACFQESMANSCPRKTLFIPLRVQWWYTSYSLAKQRQLKITRWSGLSGVFFRNECNISSIGTRAFLIILHVKGLGILFMKKEDVHCATLPLSSVCSKHFLKILRSWNARFSLFKISLWGCCRQKAILGWVQVVLESNRPAVLGFFANFF